MDLVFLKKKDPFYYSIKELLNFKPKSLKFYKRAFTHRSLNKKDLNGLAVNYERLEFFNFNVDPNTVEIKRGMFPNATPAI